MSLQMKILIYLLTGFLGGFVVIGALWAGWIDPYVPVFHDKPGLKLALIYFMTGIIGGTLYCLRRFHQMYTSGQLDLNRYWIWYLLRPLFSGGTAVMTIILLKSGILIFTIDNTVESKVGLSFLVGYGFGKLMQRLEVTINSLFGEENHNTASHPSAKTSPSMTVDASPQASSPLKSVQVIPPASAPLLTTVKAIPPAETPDADVKPIPPASQPLMDVKAVPPAPPKAAGGGTRTMEPDSPR